MSPSVDLYGTAYGNFATRALNEVRCDTYGDDFGQSSWVTADEYRRFFRLLDLGPNDHVLDVGCGSGGPAVFVAREVGCRVTGIDFNDAGIRAGKALVQQAKLENQIDFHHADIRDALPFPDGTFSAIVSIDVMCHLVDRAAVFSHWRRVLRPGGRILDTDPVVVTGLVSKEEFATRSSTGDFAFGPPGVNEQMIRDAGLELLAVHEATDNEVEVSRRWHDAREKQAAALVQLEGEETFAGLQRFLATVHRLTRERRMSRYVYVGRKPRE
jgi:cyclopropane fatty-acyl-phospholipid synthase-like methyltransferase